MLYLILGLMIAGCVLQGTFIAVEHNQKFVGAVVLKGLASVVFCVIGYVALLSFVTSSFSLAKLVFIGLVLGAVGDILLNLRFVFPTIGQKIFLAGIAAFLAGHIVYMVSLIQTSSTILVCTICGAVLAVILLTIIFKSFELKIAFKIFGVLYIGAVCLMASYSIGNAITAGFTTNTLLYAIGAVLFLVSDVVLIFNTFGPTQKFSLRITNLSLYYLGQLLIASSLYFIC